MFDRSLRSRFAQPAFRPSVQAGATPYTPRFATAHPADMSAAQPPPIIAGEAELHIVDSARGWRELRKFRCGYSESKAEVEIHLAAKKLFAGEPIDPGLGVSGAPYQRIIALERSSGELLSWCAITRRHLCEVPARIAPGGYICAIATAHAYRGWRLDRYGTRPSDAVLRRALEVMNEDLGEAGMPYVWARVLPDNRDSNRLFNDHGFDLYPRAHEEQAIRVRPAGIDPALSRLPADLAETLAA
jgi:hypothetical protein